MKFIYTALLAGIAASAGAQTETGNFMVGANILSTSVNFQKDNTGFDIALQPKVGYFINDNIALGVAVELGLNAVKSNTTMNYGITPFARVFIGNKSVTDIPKRIMFFVEAGGGFGGRNSRFEDQEGNKTNVTSNGAVFYAGPGMDVFLSRNVAFELGAEYRYIGGEPRVNRVGLNLGFQIFLNRTEGKAMAKGTEAQKG
jgi:hypothetical protein